MMDAAVHEVILAFFLQTGLLGNSPYSFEPVEACGTDPKQATCKLEPVCANRHDFRCAPPRWSAARGAWVRVETPETAEARARAVAQALERTAVYLTNCQLPDGTVTEDCELAGWPRGPGQARDLAYSAASVVFWESGVREDIQGGYPPAGRGTAGEGCLMQIMPTQAPAFAQWLPPEERQAGRPRDETEQVIQSMLGFDETALVRCFSVGMRMLARARRACRGKGDWHYGMFALYGTGSACSSYGFARGDFAAKRQRTYHLLKRFNPASPRHEESYRSTSGPRGR
jgi:hypothetical protein